jgi:type III pantothenate kinase
MELKNNGVFLIDIGNTNTLIGYSQTDNNLENIISYRFSTKKNTTVDDFGINLMFVLNSLEINKKNIKSTIISSVVPEINHNIKNSIEKYINAPAFFTSDIKTEKLPDLLKINYKNPKEIGADRLVNAMSAIYLYGYPSIVIDIGTAGTIDIVNNKKEFIGGAIFPGIEISADILAKMTSKLPKIDIRSTEKFIGTNTKESINIGIYQGFIGSIKYFCENLKKDPQLKDAKIILTGGWTDIYKNHNEIFDIYDKNLTLKGLKIIYLEAFKN